MKPSKKTPLTESFHPASAVFERLPTRKMVATLLAADARSVAAVKRAAPQVARAVNLVVAAIRAGGRLIYVGAGTSGRLAWIDAVELMATFGVEQSEVLALLAGGDRALFRPIEGAEDDTGSILRKLRSHKVAAPDVLCAIAASGTTPVATRALAWAKKNGLKTIFITATPAALHRGRADVTVAIPVGPEVLPGSTRLSAATATKMVLGTLSTAAMAQLGHVYRGRMVDIRISSKKLAARAENIVVDLAHVNRARARALLRAAGGHPKVALVMAKYDVTAAQARLCLKRADNRLSELL